MNGFKNQIRLNQKSGTLQNLKVFLLILSHLGGGMRYNPVTFMVITGIFVLVFITLIYNIL